MPGDYSQDDAVRRYGRANVEDLQSKEIPGLFRVWCKPRCRYRKAVMPHSEVNMHMRIAGRPMDFEFLVSDRGYPPSVQLYQPDTDIKFSSPITYGEAGVYFAGRDKITPEADQYPYYFYPNFPSAEPEPAAVLAIQERLDII